jgi:hypothetical protein
VVADSGGSAAMETVAVKTASTVGIQFMPKKKVLREISLLQSRSCTIHGESEKPEFEILHITQET